MACKKKIIPAAYKMLLMQNANFDVTEADLRFKTHLAQSLIARVFRVFRVAFGYICKQGFR